MGATRQVRYKGELIAVDSREYAVNTVQAPLSPCLPPYRLVTAASFYITREAFLF